MNCQARWTTLELYAKGSFATPTGRGESPLPVGVEYTDAQIDLTPTRSVGVDLTPTGSVGGVGGGPSSGLSDLSGSGSSPDLYRLDLSNSNTMSRQSGRSVKSRPVVYSAEFLVFWDEYPRKVKKPMAALEWERQRPDIVAVLNALKWQCRQPEWQRDGGQYVPHPSTYLYNRRWEDEQSAAPIVSKREANTVAAGVQWQAMRARARDGEGGK